MCTASPDIGSGTGPDDAAGVRRGGGPDDGAGVQPGDKPGGGSAADRITALERVAAAAWPAPDTARLGGWLLRAAGGWTGRANSVLPLGDPGVPLGTALTGIRAWYAARDLPARINVPLPLGTNLDRSLGRRAWCRSEPVLVQVATLDGVRHGVRHAIGGSRGRPPQCPVAIDAVPTDDWLAVVADRKHSLPGVAYGILTGGPRVGFATVRAPDGTLRAIARGVADGDWLGLFLIEVTPLARRQGLARQMIGALAGWAADHGATRAYLQVVQSNTAATTLYRTLGFRTHHRYVSRTLSNG